VTEIAATSEVIKYEYHVLYSCSYQVPVLYFRASFLGKTVYETKSKFIAFICKAENIFGKSFSRGKNRVKNNTVGEVRFYQ
jgi:hypothetical protein